MKFIALDGQIMDTEKMHSFNLNEKTPTHKTRQYASLVKIDMRSTKRTELKRVYRKSQLKELQEMSARLNQQDADQTWYYTIIIGIEVIK